jgi:hypothetical protein
MSALETLWPRGQRARLADARPLPVGLQGTRFCHQGRYHRPMRHCPYSWPQVLAKGQRYICSHFLGLRVYADLIPFLTLGLLGKLPVPCNG